MKRGTWIILLVLLVELVATPHPLRGEESGNVPSSNIGTRPDKMHDLHPVFDMPHILKLDYVKEGAGNRIQLKWKLSESCDFIVICRGSQQIYLLPGDAEEFTYEEDVLGYFRYTVALFSEGEWVDQKDVLVEIGNIGWDPPPGQYSGYYLYVAEAIGDPYTALPYDQPSNYTIDMLIYDRIWLVMLYNLGFIEDGKSYYVATSAYQTGCPDTVISPLTEPITFTYHVVLGKPTP